MCCINVCVCDVRACLLFRCCCCSREADTAENKPQTDAKSTRFRTCTSAWAKSERLTDFHSIIFSFLAPHLRDCGEGLKKAQKSERNEYTYWMKTTRAHRRMHIKIKCITMKLPIFARCTKKTTTDMNFNSLDVLNGCMLYVWFYKSIGTWQVIYRRTLLFYAIVEI